jgi:hypothetical protein
VEMSRSSGVVILGKRGPDMACASAVAVIWSTYQLYKHGNERRSNRL